MIKKIAVLLTPLILLAFGFLFHQCRTESSETLYADSETCRACHEKFYQLWSPSHHGQAMQGVDSTFITTHLTFNNEEIKVQQYGFKAITRHDSLFLVERQGNQTREYPAIHALGGKYIFYFLTPLEKGKLQVLPLAYDVKQHFWYNTPASAVRHFVDPLEDEELDWHSFAYTFNTSCHSCHVSQLSNVYNPENQTYHTTWREPGINCETCHGPSADHIRACKKAGPEKVPEDLKIIITKKFSHEQHNSSCGSCHAKMRPLTASFPPGERFYDHFDLITLENPDFYPDGRDLGENYTYTGWRMSGCAQSGQLDCIHCHTSSGRYRFKTENPNGACMPCHKDKVENIAAHSHHPEGTEGITCIACHMPKTRFARMERTDHSMRPPMPGASLAFGSPNACNLCHTDRDTLWADARVKEWHRKWDQDQVIRQGQLLLEARNGNWKHLDQIVNGLQKQIFGEVYATSFIRLLESCPDPGKWAGIIPHLKDPSPLVRSAAVHSLGQISSPDVKPAVIEALKDDYLLVRRAATSAISSFPKEAFTPKELEEIKPLMKEYETSFLTRPDDWAAHFNLGNLYQNTGRYQEAVQSYEKSLAIFPDRVATLVNESYTYNLLNKKELALNRLYRALKIDPGNEAANLNFAMLIGEMGRLEEAEQALRTALRSNPHSSQAAYNLGIILADRDSVKSLNWIRKATEWSPGEPRYQYTYAYYLYQYGRHATAIQKLRQIITDTPWYPESWIFLGSIYIKEKKMDQARALYQKALHSNQLSEQDKKRIRTLLDQLKY